MPKIPAALTLFIAAILTGCASTVKKPDEYKSKQVCISKVANKPTAITHDTATQIANINPRHNADSVQTGRYSVIKKTKSKNQKKPKGSDSIERGAIQKSYSIEDTYLTIDFHEYDLCETGYSPRFVYSLIHRDIFCHTVSFKVTNGIISRLLRGLMFSVLAMISVMDGVNTPSSSIH